MNRSAEIDASQETASLPLERYLHGAIRLRQAAEWNTFDNNPKGDLPDRIIPIIDADVVRMFLAPAEETSYVEPFASSRSGYEERRQWDDPLALVATATAEFIFLSDTIEVFDRHVSNWKEPVRIAPSHFLDLEDMLFQITNKIETGMASIGDLEDKAIEALDPVIEGARRDREQGLSKLVNALPSALRDLYLGPVYEAVRWRRLREERMLLRLEGLAEAIPEVLEPRDEVIEQWREPLFRAVAPSKSSAPERARHRDPEVAKRRAHDRRERARRRASRDATALACVTALNEAGLKAGRKAGWRAILISGDDHLHRVYADWAWKTSGRGLQPKNYVLRRPLQFTPVLNLANMSDQPKMVDIFHQLTGALDLAVDMMVDRWERAPSPFLLEHYWDHHREHLLNTIDQKGIHSHLERCKNFWLEAINHINARNHPYLTRDYHKLLKTLQKAFDEPDARQGLIDNTRSLVEDINAEHFHLVLQETMYELAKFSAPQRMPFLVRTEFPEFLFDQSSSITSFLYGEPPSLQVARHELEQLKRVAQRIEDAPGPRASFLAAILAATGGAYSRASRLMDRAQQLAEDPETAPELRAEMDYFQAVLLRLTVNQQQDYRAASDVARRLLEAATPSSDRFLKARAYSETGALELQWYATDALWPGNRISAEQRFHLTEADKRLGRARELLTPPATTADRYQRELAQQIIVNTMALNAYLKLGGSAPDLDTLRWASEQFDLLLGGAGDADYLTELWRRAAIWLLNPAPQNKEALRLHCKNALARLPSETPAADRNDLEYVLAYLQSTGELAEK